MFILFLDMGLVLRQRHHLHFMQYENKQTQQIKVIKNCTTNKLNKIDQTFFIVIKRVYFKKRQEEKEYKKEK